MSIYTKKGDHGKTTDLTGNKLRKSDLRAEVLGEIDELNSSLGAVRTFLPADPRSQKVNELLNNIQQILMSVSSEIAGSPNLRLDESPTTNLEKIIDHYWQQLPELKNFIVPGGTSAAALCHVSRTICRRTERKVVRLNEIKQLNPHILKFMNRLSDLLFTLARMINHIEGGHESIWQGKQQ